MDDSRDVLLKGQGLVKEFKMGKSTVHAVADVDIEIRTGETLSLVGESGCGKSTLGRLLLGLLKPDQGKIWFENRELVSMKRREFQKVRRDFQSGSQAFRGQLHCRAVVDQPGGDPGGVHEAGG